MAGLSIKIAIFCCVITCGAGLALAALSVSTESYLSASVYAVAAAIWFSACLELLGIASRRAEHERRRDRDGL